MSQVFDKTIDTLSKSMDMYLVRHAVTADNIANAETPGFKARRVEFEAELDRALRLQDSGISDNSIDEVRPEIVQDIDSEMGQDLNTVDMDREMTAMSKNNTKYSAASQAINKKFALLKYAISEGGER